MDKLAGFAVLAVACILGHLAATPLAGPSRNVFVTWVGATLFAIVAEVAIVFIAEPRAIDPIMVSVQLPLIGGVAAALAELALIVLPVRKPPPRRGAPMQAISMVLIGCACLSAFLWYQSVRMIGWEQMTVVRVKSVKSGKSRGKPVEIEGKSGDGNGKSGEKID